MNRKTLTIAITIASLFMTGLSAVKGWVPPGWGLIVASLVTGIYALVRAGQKVLDGADWKTLRSSTETWAAVVTWAGSFVGLVSGVVPAKYVGTASAIAGALLAMSRQLNGQTSPIADRMRVLGKTGAIPVADIKPVVTPLPRIPGPGVVALLVLAGALLAASPARAQTPSPQLGFCVDSWNTCFQPAAAISAFQLNLKTLDYYRVALMAGYGGVWHGPIDLGAAVYVGAGISTTAPNAGQASLLFSFSDLAAAGPGVQVFKDPLNGNLVWQGLLTFAVNYNVGASPTFLRKVAAQHTLDGFETGQRAGVGK
jgi:hypothetical protein